LTVDALKERLKGTKDNFALTNSLTEEYYPGLKDVRARFDQAYEKTGRVPSLPSTDSSDKFEVGKTYTDRDGNKATYLGNGQWKEQ
jgi:transketolase C-terminal domain/subunit